MADTFGLQLCYITVCSVPVFVVVYLINFMGGKQLSEYGMFGLVSILGGLVCVYGLNIAFAYLAHDKDQQHDRQAKQDEMDNKLKKAEDDRQTRELEVGNRLKQAEDDRQTRKLDAEMKKEIVELRLKMDRQDHEIKVNEGIEASKVQIMERRASDKAATELKKIEYDKDQQHDRQAGLDEMDNKLKEVQDFTQTRKRECEVLADFILEAQIRLKKGEDYIQTRKLKAEIGKEFVELKLSILLY